MSGRTPGRSALSHHARRLRRAAHQGAQPLRGGLRHRHRAGRGPALPDGVRAQVGDRQPGRDRRPRACSATTRTRAGSSTPRRSGSTSFSTLSCDVQTLVPGFVDGVNAHVAAIYADTTLAARAARVLLPADGHPDPGQRSRSRPACATRSRRSAAREVFRPDAWRVTDVLAIGALLAGRFGSGGGRQLRQAALLNYLTALFTRDGAPAGKTRSRGGRDVFEDVRWLNDPKAPTTIPATGAINPVRGGQTPVPLADAAPAARRRCWRTAAAPARRRRRPSARPTIRAARQHDFVQALAPSTILRGLARGRAAWSAQAQRAQPPLRRLRHLGQQRVGGGAGAQRDGQRAPLGRTAGGLRQPEHRLGGRTSSRRTMKAGGMMIAGRPGRADRPDAPRSRSRRRRARSTTRRSTSRRSRRRPSREPQSDSALVRASCSTARTTRWTAAPRSSTSPARTRPSRRRTRRPARPWRRPAARSTSSA